MGEHAHALDYDLMTMTGRTLDEYVDMGAAGLVALAHFVRHLGPGSALWREMNPDDEAPRWTGRASTNAILADIYDAIAQLNANFIRSRSKRKPRTPKPYPRPNAKARGEVIGKDAVKVRDFDSWWKSSE